MDSEVGLNVASSAAQTPRSYPNEWLTGYSVRNLMGRLIDVLRYSLEVMRANSYRSD